MKHFTNTSDMYIIMLLTCHLPFIFKGGKREIKDRKINDVLVQHKTLASVFLKNAQQIVTKPYLWSKQIELKYKIKKMNSSST